MSVTCGLTCCCVWSQVGVTLQDVDQVDTEQVAAIVGVHSQPQQPQLARLQALAAMSQRLIALVDGADKVCNSYNLQFSFHLSRPCRNGRHAAVCHCPRRRRRQGVQQIASANFC